MPFSPTGWDVTAWGNAPGTMVPAPPPHFFVVEALKGRRIVATWWSVAAENRPDAQPVETERNLQYSLSVDLFAPEGRLNKPRGASPWIRKSAISLCLFLFQSPVGATELNRPDGA